MKFSPAINNRWILQNRRSKGRCTTRRKKYLTKSSKSSFTFRLNAKQLSRSMPLFLAAPDLFFGKLLVPNKYWWLTLQSEVAVSNKSNFPDHKFNHFPKCMNSEQIVYVWSRNSFIAWFPAILRPLKMILRLQRFKCMYYILVYTYWNNFICIRRSMSDTH